MRNFRSWLVLPVLFTVALGGLIAAKASDGGAAGGDFRSLSATWVEFCSCDRICESALAEPGRRSPCSTVAALQINTGRKGEVHIDGISAAVVAPGPDATGAKVGPQLYVDPTARPDQAEAIATILNEKFEGRFGGKLGPPKLVKIQVMRTKENLIVRIDGVADLKGRPVAGMFGQTVQLENAGSSLGYPLVGRGTGGQVTDPITGVRFDAEGRSVLFGKFDVGIVKGKK